MDCKYKRTDRPWLYFMVFMTMFQTCVHKAEFRAYKNKVELENKELKEMIQNISSNQQNMQGEFQHKLDNIDKNTQYILNK